MKRLHIAIYLLLSGMALSSCLKEKHKIAIDDNTDRVITEFTTARQGVNSLALEFGTSTIEVDLTELRVIPRAALAGSVQVKIAENKALVTTAGYSTLPLGSYSITGLNYTFTPENRKANVRLKINPSVVVGGSYAIGLSIMEVSNGEIASLAKDILIEVKVKNDYEGEYHATGERILYNGATVGSGISAAADIDDDKYLYTVDQNTVETDVAELIGQGYMFLEIDPVTFDVTVSPSTLNPTFLLSNNGPCKYDPSTGTFTLNYKYFNGAGNLRTITETIVIK
jgi:Domain of unknown function (DUF4361)